MKKFLTFLCLISISLVTFGAWLENVPTRLVQPNGEVLNLFLSGDEFYNRVHDIEGYSIVQGKDGWYYYAVYDVEKDALVPSEYVVTANRGFDLPMPKNLGISQKKYMEIRSAYYEPTGCDPSGASKNSILKDLAKNGKSTQQMTNIVICIGFSDTEQMTRPFSYVDGMFNTKEGNNMRDYFMTMSYNRLDIESHFFPPGDENDLLRFYKDIYPRDYYLPYHETNNPIGYDPEGEDRIDREQTLLKNAVEWVNQNWPVPADLNLDINNDGDCDFVSFIIHGKPGEWATLLWPHKWSLWWHDVYINNKRVWEYNFELDGEATYFSNNVFCHEGYHVLGAPDLYHYSNPEGNGKPVDRWDLMENNYLSKPQSMCAYMKHKYGNWAPNAPANATLNKTHEVYPFYYHDGTDAEKPISYKIPMTGNASQLTLFEYRKKTGTNYDAYIPGQGLLIYRINTTMGGNAGFNGEDVYDEVFLYRPNGVQTGGLYTNGNINQAAFSQLFLREVFNSESNPKPCQSDGTLEYNLNINNIFLDTINDCYTFFYGDPENRFFSVDKTELVLYQQVGSASTVAVTSNVFWQIEIPEDAKEWLEVSTMRGINDGSIIFSIINENTTGEQRYTYVTITGNDQTYTVKIVQETFVGINDIKNAGDFLVYPNPTTGELRIDNGQLTINNVEVYDIMGKKQEIIVNYQLSIVDCSHLSSGIYFIRISDSQNSYIQRFVKE